MEKIPSQSLVQKTKALWLRKYGKAINDEEVHEILRKLALFGELLFRAESNHSSQENFGQRKDSR